KKDLNMHVKPARDSDHLYQLKENDRVELLRRATAAKTSAPQVAKPAPTAAGPKEPPAEPIIEDWWLARDSAGHSGWVLARMLDLEVPLEVAQYAEGQRIIAVFTLNEVHDKDKEVPQYLMLLSEPKEGLDYDFDQIRVFT